MNGVINGILFRFTTHAWARLVAMDCAEDVRAVLENPRVRVDAPNGTEEWTRGKVTVVVAPKDGYWSVVTVLWATANGWVDDTSRADEMFTPERMRAMRYAIKQRKKGRPKW